MESPARPREDLRRQLPRPGGARRLGRGRQLRELPRRPRHPPLLESGLAWSTAPTSRRPAAPRAAIPGPTPASRVGKVHVTGTEKDSPLIYWIATLYLDPDRDRRRGHAPPQPSRFRAQVPDGSSKVRRGEIEEEPAGHALYLRMTVSERLQHGALALSFIAARHHGLHAALSRGLVGSGHPARQARGLHAPQPDRTESRPSSWSRRASTTPATCSYGPRPPACSRDLWWRGKDLRDAIATLKYNTGLSRERPEYDRFSYIEKSEYWALVWGTLRHGGDRDRHVVRQHVHRAPEKLGYDVSRTIHF